MRSNDIYQYLEIEWTEIVGSGRELTGVDGNCREWTGIDGSGRELSGVDGNCRE